MISKRQDVFKLLSVVFINLAIHIHLGEKPSKVGSPFKVSSKNGNFNILKLPISI